MKRNQIPKIIHYVWIGKNPPKLDKDRYLKSWQKHNCSFKIKLWNEDNINMADPYIKKATKLKNWANISNYVRLLAVYRHGGIYLDTDVMVIKSFDTLLKNRCFFGFQQKEKKFDWVNNVVFGAQKNHWFIKKCIENLRKDFDGSEEANESSPGLVTKLLEEEGLKEYSTKPLTIKDIKIYPLQYFYPYAWDEKFTPSCIKRNTYAIHFWSKRWGVKKSITKVEKGLGINKTKLVMTLLVRDETDIVEQNICFHLNHGVDYIIATDNGSTDGTLEVLEKYKKKGVLELIQVKEHTYEQSRWVSRMAKRAVETHKATHLFHCDADEFWYPKSGNLKENLPSRGEIFLVPLINYLPEPFTIPLISKRLVVAAPYNRFAYRGQDPSYRYLLYKYPPKIITTREFTKVIQGNHGIVTKKQHKETEVNDIFIHHFPIRSYKQFERKVINGGSSYEKNPDKSPDIGWHWKEWYLLYKKGLLHEVYEAMCINSKERKLLLAQGVLEKIRFPKSIMFSKYLYGRR